MSALTQMPKPVGMFELDSQTPVVQSSVLSFPSRLHAFKHCPKASEHTYPAAQGHAFPSCPVPGVMQEVVPSPLTTPHAFPEGQVQLTSDGQG
ncbi:MAG: hypothetical protein QM784_20425 [Polyangiaceae bacterium]